MARGRFRLGQTLHCRSGASLTGDPRFHLQRNFNAKAYCTTVSVTVVDWVMPPPEPVTVIL